VATKGEHHLSLVDDLSADAGAPLKSRRYDAGLPLVETRPEISRMAEATPIKKEPS